MLTIPETPPAAQSGDASQPGWIWGSLFEHAAAWNGEVGSAFTDLSAEYLDFIRRRGHEDADFLSRLAACKTPAELMQAYQTFFLTASGDYRNECAALAHIGNRLLSGWANLLPDAAKP